MTSCLGPLVLQSQNTPHSVCPFTHRPPSGLLLLPLDVVIMLLRTQCPSFCLYTALNSSRYTPSHGIAGSCSHPVFNSLRKWLTPQGHSPTPSHLLCLLSAKARTLCSGHCLLSHLATRSSGHYSWSLLSDEKTETLSDKTPYSSSCDSQ